MTAHMSKWLLGVGEVDQAGCEAPFQLVTGPQLNSSPSLNDLSFSSLCQFVFSLISTPPSSVSSALSLSILSPCSALQPPFFLTTVLSRSKFHPFDENTDTI